jgi:hypothetical protein
MAQLHKVNGIQVELKLSTLSIEDRVSQAAVLAKMAPQSALYAANAAVKDTADTVIQGGVALQGAATEVQNLEMMLAAAKSVLMAVGTQYDKKMLCFKSALEANCNTDAELNALGFNRRRPKAAAALTAPDAIVLKPGKEQGSMIAQAKRVGRSFTYVAEISADPVGSGTWQTIPGSGARRTLSGYVSGACYWVRFRSVRANEESAWSAPAAGAAR